MNTPKSRGARRRKVAACVAAFALCGSMVATSASAAGAVEEPITVATEPYAVAAVSAPSVEFDLEASIARADDIAAEAAASGAKLVAFGELWLPGYPKSLNTDPNWIETPDYAAYVANALVVGSPQWKALLDVADANDVFVSIGFAELSDGHLFMGQALIDPDGSAIEVRRKVRPSGSERSYFSDSTMAGNLDVAQTTLGRIGMLECWEHLHAQMFYPMHAKGENVHIAAWPYVPFTGDPAAFWEDSTVALSAARMYAIEGGTAVVTPGVGQAFIMNRRGEVLAQAVPGDDFVVAKIDPRGFGGGDVYNPTGENSWGVLQMIAGTFPESARVPDASHEQLNLVPISAAVLPTPAPTPTSTPSGSESPSPAPSASPAAAALPSDEDPADAGALATTGGVFGGGLVTAAVIAVALGSALLLRRRWVATA